MKLADVKDGIYRVHQQIRMLDEHGASLYGSAIMPGIYFGKVVEHRVEIGHAAAAPPALSPPVRRLRLTSKHGKLSYIDLFGAGEFAVGPLELLFGEECADCGGRNSSHCAVCDGFGVTFP